MSLASKHNNQETLRWWFLLGRSSRTHTVQSAEKGFRQSCRLRDTEQVWWGQHVCELICPTHTLECGLQCTSCTQQQIKQSPTHAWSMRMNKLLCVGDQWKYPPSPSNQFNGEDTYLQTCHSISNVPHSWCLWLAVIPWTAKMNWSMTAGDVKTDSKPECWGWLKTERPPIHIMNTRICEYSSPALKHSRSSCMEVRHKNGNDTLNIKHHQFTPAHMTTIYNETQVVWPVKYAFLWAVVLFKSVNYVIMLWFSCKFKTFQ